MTQRLVKCVKLGKELPGLDYPPFGGALGDKIWLEVSEEAWKMFLEQFKMIMNEYRLQGGSEAATKAFYEQAEKYFYGEGTQAPPEFKPQ
jgi:Fe-S cluster biosynthesis and repair protein YggX